MKLTIEFFLKTFYKNIESVCRLCCDNFTVPDRPDLSWNGSGHCADPDVLRLVFQSELILKQGK